jgi:hypothetical protein
VFLAEDSPVVAQPDERGWPFRPQAGEPDGVALVVRQHDLAELVGA